ncbi:MAG: hypothetical protein LBV71_20010 [Prevotella sp.]|jgi:hypothetical protein|nr:hypothetical protein [Prevotella sp.]
MRKIIYFVALLSLFSLLGCENTPSPIPIIEMDLRFNLFDESGNDLLDPDFEEGINAHRIRIFYMVDGKAREYYNVMSGAPKGYVIYEPDLTQNHYTLNLFLDRNIDDGKSTTIIRWNDFDSDTIMAQVDKRENDYVVATKFWINGNENIDWIDEGQRICKLVK